MNKLSKSNYCYVKVSKIIVCCASMETKMSIKLQDVTQNQGQNFKDMKIKMPEL